KAINFAILNTKALIANKITTGDLINESDIKPVLLSAAARYAVLNLKIPSPSTDFGLRRRKKSNSSHPLPPSTRRLYQQF
ncbi:Uncharacterized protein FKW44_009753, partial [Caligus rogercresseyi]